MELKIEKRDGRVVPYDVKKIEQSINGAMNSVGIKNGHDIVALVEEKLNEIEDKTISVETVQDIIEECLMDLGYNDVAKEYILYREKHRRQRDLRKSLGLLDELKLSINSARLLHSRYLGKDKEGIVDETPSELFRRVAKHVAKADLNYDKKADIEAVEELFYRAMTNMEFLPNSPTLFSAGRSKNTFAACFTLDVEDSLEDIFEKVKQTGIITKMGGGVGLAFSNLRPKDDIVGSTGGISSGPISFMRIFNTAIDVCKQGGVRRGALMGVLRVDHPDILEFIQCKQDKKSFKNFNISVLITDEFMTAYYDDETYDLVNPRTGEVVKTLPARMVMNQIVISAYNTGDPGMVFIDRINKKHPVRNVEIKGVNVCGEQDLAPNESCLLGAVNLSKFVTDKKVNYKELRRVVTLAVHFLDNLIDINNYPLPQIEEATKKSRRIGVGIMGWAEMLIQLGVPYDSPEALELADSVMGFIDKEAHKASRDLALIRGNFPAFGDYKKSYRNMRNAVLTTVAPTGSRAILANTSGGIEPLFAVAETRVTGDGMILSDFNKYFIAEMKERDLWSEDLKLLVGKKGYLKDLEEIPEDVRELFKTSHEIPPMQHVLMQAAFQKHIGSSVSKTVNLSNDATLEDVKAVYLKAYETGCKGTTIFRDGCLGGQVLYQGCETCDI